MEKPTYFSILTATVRYCPNIGDFERVLYSEISSLTHKWGFCTASNDYLGELYNKAPETISRSISKLVKAGHLVIQIDQKGNSPRKIYLAETAHLLTKTSTPLDENVNRPLDENVKHNNTSNNNKLKSIVGKPDNVEKLTTIVEGAITLLNELTKSGFKPTSRKTRDTIKARVNEGYTLADLEEVIRHKVAAWLHDPKQNQYLRPETLFGSKFEGYLQCAKRANQINQIETLIDIELTEQQGQLYLDYYQYTRDKYPRLFTTTRIIPASEYFALKPGGKRHRGLSIKWSPGELKTLFKSAHDEAAQLVDAGKHCQAVIEVLNQKLSK